MIITMMMRKTTTDRALANVMISFVFDSVVEERGRGRGGGEGRGGEGRGREGRRKFLNVPKQC